MKKFIFISIAVLFIGFVMGAVVLSQSESYNRQLAVVDSAMHDVVSLKKAIRKISVDKYFADIKLHKYSQKLQREFIELKRIKASSGAVNLTGSGVRVAMEDANQNLNGVIHDYDLMLLVNELFSYGAEAISVGGKTFGSHSYFKCNGPVIIYDDCRIASPFEILAIGDSEDIESNLMKEGGYVNRLANLYGINFTIEFLDDIIINGYEY